MVIAVEVNIKPAASKLNKVKKLVSNPFTPYFCLKVKQELINRIRDAQGERPLPYHTYPHTPRIMENLAYVEPYGKNSIIIGDNAPYASVLETGRRKMNRYKHPFVFEGYYPNPKAVRYLLKNSRVPWLTSRHGYFTQKGKHGERFYSRYEASEDISPKQRKKMNIDAVVGTLENDIDIMRSSYKTYRDDTQKMRVRRSAARTWSRIAGKFRDNLMYHRLRSFQIPRGSSTKYKYGAYTVFAYHLKAIPPYQIFTETAEWAKKELRRRISSKIAEINRGEIMT